MGRRSWCGNHCDHDFTLLDRILSQTRCIVKSWPAKDTVISSIPSGRRYSLLSLGPLMPTAGEVRAACQVPLLNPAVIFSFVACAGLGLHYLGQRFPLGWLKPASAFHMVCWLQVHLPSLVSCRSFPKQFDVVRQVSPWKCSLSYVSECSKPASCHDIAAGGGLLIT